MTRVITAIIVSPDQQDVIDLLELQRLTRELLDHLHARFEPHEVALVLRAMADGVEEKACAQRTTTSYLRACLTGRGDEN